MNIFKQLYKSIYSPKDIALFRFQGIGKTILFVFLLSLISILPTIVYLSMTITTGIDSARSVIIHQLPSFSIKNGQLTAQTSVPVTIDKDHFTIILDPTGAVSVKEIEGTENAFALLKNQFVVAVGGKTNTYPYSMVSGMDITKPDLVNFFNTLYGLKVIAIFVISLFIYIFSSAASFIEVSVLAFLGLGLKNLAGRRLNYRQLWRMAAYSETLPTVFFAIMSAIKTTVPNSFLINWFVVVIVLYLAINEIPKPKTTA